MLKSSKKGAVLFIGLAAALVAVSLGFKSATAEKFTIENISGDKKALEDANLIYSSSADYLQDIRKDAKPVNKDFKSNSSILIRPGKNTALKYTSSKDNKLIYSDKNGEKYNVNHLSISNSLDEENKYIVYYDTENSIYKKLPIKDSGALSKYTSYYYQNYYPMEYKGEKYIVGYFMDTNIDETVEKELKLSMVAIKLEKNNSYTEVAEKTFKVKNFIKKNEEGKEVATGKYFKFFSNNSMCFLTLKIEGVNSLNLYSYNPEKNEFLQEKSIDESMLPSIEYDDSFFVNYKNKINYIYLKGNRQYIQEIQYKNGTLVSSKPSATGFKRNAPDSNFSEMNFDKNGNKISIDSKDFDYNFLIQTPQSHYFVKGNKVILVSDTNLSVSNNRGNYIMMPIYMVNILNLDTGKEIYNGLIRANFRADMNNIFIADKI